MTTRRQRMTWYLPATVLAFVGLSAWGCGTSPSTTAASGTSTEGDGGSTAATTSMTGGGDGGARPQDVPSACQSPSGYQVCGGPNHCPYDVPSCPENTLVEEEDEAKGVLGLCFNDVFSEYVVESDETFCVSCDDGDICFDEANLGFAAFCMPFEVGPLVQQNGAAARLRYADHSLWTGQVLPAPATCPILADVPTCGGLCGDCAEGEVCTGRSPLHPYGLCVPTDADADASTNLLGYCNEMYPCKAGFGCFHWTVQPEAQQQADDFGFCLPLKTCKAAAANIPGGGYCDAP